MAAMHPRRDVPSLRAGEMDRLVALVFLMLVGLDLWPLISGTFSVQAHGGHLPWPVLQWAFGTMIGQLLMVAVAGGVLGLPLCLWVRFWSPKFLAGAPDFTEVPPGEWREHAQRFPAPDRMDRWLGLDARTRGVSLALVTTGLVLGVALVAAMFVAQVRIPVEVSCYGSACPPGYPTEIVFPASIPVALVVLNLDTFWWLRRVEARCGIRLYTVYGLGRISSRYVYLRRPGTSPEAAAAALFTLAPGRQPSLARVCATLPLALLPLAALFVVTELLNLWLQSHWIPG